MLQGRLELPGNVVTPKNVAILLVILCENKTLNYHSLLERSLRFWTIIAGAARLSVRTSSQNNVRITRISIVSALEMLYRSINFWMLDITASLLVFSSAWYGRTIRRRKTLTEVSDVVSSVDKEKESSGEITNSNFGETLRRLLFYTAYFAMMAVSIALFQWHPYFMVFVQHITVIICILIIFLQCFQPHLALCLGGLFSITWIASASTTFRWILNDVVIALFSLLVSHVHFQNFPSLQIFLWIAVVYDVCLVNTLSKGLPSLLSVGNCDTMLCNVFEINNQWELPTIFTFKLGPRDGHVFLGAGDIIIGCLVANFSQKFFRSPRYLSGTVLSYALAIALLSRVDDEPYPALVTIVPLCSCQLVVSAILSRKAKKLFSFTCLESGEREGVGSLVRDLELLI